MPPEALLEALKKPFFPFRLYLSDGATYVIRHPDLIWVAPRYAIILVPPTSPQPAQIERHEVVALSHITRLEPLESLAGVTGNGE